MQPTVLSAAIVAAIMSGFSPLLQADGQQADACMEANCATQTDLPVIIGSLGRQQPVTRDAPTSSAALAPDRRVVVEGEYAPGKAVAMARVAVDLPNGGLIWATEDPTLGAPILNIQSSSLTAFENGQFAEPVRFHVYSNYPGFIERMELTLYRGNDLDLVTPLATQVLEPASSVDLDWEVSLPEGLGLLPGDELQYVLRAYGADGSVDETWPQRLQLVRPQERQRNLEELRRKADSFLRDLSADELERRRLLQASYGQGSNLRQQNIAIYGSRVRISGQDLPDGFQLLINDQSIPVDQERKFVAEYLLPVGSHEFAISLRQGNRRIDDQLSVDVSGRHMFLVAIADVTASENRVSGAVEALSADDRYEDFLVEGRLGFYLKGKIQGKYLITAHADTQEQRTGDLFTGFLRAEPQDIFRRLDPDAYYPVYGDDSTTTRDVDTQGKLYVRVDWDQNQALWGNFQTGITGTEYAQYVRSLYGAAVKWRSREATALGEARSQVRVFGSEAQTGQGHSEFLGTGGSLYYLKHTDILPGSDQVVLEIRDPLTGRTEARVPLVRDVDYDMDELQGRVILMRPLMQISRENNPNLSRDTPLGGFLNVLLVDYEYISRGLSDGELTAGARGKQWFGDHLALGATYVEEKRDADDYRLMGVDLTLQAGRGTYLTLEQARTESTATSIFRSDNGGLSFTRINPLGSREGDAYAAEARANLRELGYTEQDWSVGGWYRDAGAGYSISRFDLGMPLVEWGASFSGELTERLGVSGQISDASRGQDRYEQAQLKGEMRLSGDHRTAAELRQVQETRGGLREQGTLAALSYTHRLTPAIELYGIGQVTADSSAGYENNDAVTLGGRYLFGNLSSLGGEVTSGARGDAVAVDGEYRVAADHSLYAGYTYSTDRTVDTDPLFGGAPTGLTLGQRWRVSNKTSLFNESQWLKAGNDQGVAHTFGMDFYPVQNWQYGFTLQQAELETARGIVDRNAVSLRGGHTSPMASWSSALEWRRDTGAERRRQWLTTNRLMHKLNEDWRVAGRVNYSDTRDEIDAAQGARFVESNIGFAWRPADSVRWGALGKYTYLYDRSTFEQDQSSAWYDQRSHVLALEGTYRLDQYWEFAGKVAQRYGEARAGRASGEWFDSRARFTAAQARYRLHGAWSALGEYRWLDVRDGGTRQGWLAGVDRDLGDHFRVGVGYNFTDFSDDLTRHDYRYQGWYLNMVGYY